MTVRLRLALVTVLCVALAVPLTAAAGPEFSTTAALQPCMAGAVYDPACDVDHDGDVDIFDIQLTAGHWNRNGVWTGGDYWSLLGNAATNPAVNFVGTSDNQPLAVRTNNVERVRVTSSGQVGIGLTNPADQLSVRNTGAGRAGFFQTDNGANNAAALSAVVQDGNGSAVFANILDAGNSAPGLYATTQGTGPAARLEGDTQVWNGQLEVREDNHQVAIVDDNNGNKTWTLTSHQDTSGIGLWEDATTGRLVVAAGGNVGIGTLGPAAPLHVNQAGETGTDIYVTSPEFARMRMVAEAPNPDVTLSIQARASSDGFTFAEIGTLSRHDLRLYTNGDYRVTIDDAGNVGIGTTEPNPLYRLSVNGGVRAKEVVVETGWSDFVFEDGYVLLSLAEVEAFIAQYGHLPDIPSAAEVAADGVSLGEMDARLLQKIEELTLHMIVLEKRITQLEAENGTLRATSMGVPAAAAAQGGR